MSWKEDLRVLAEPCRESVCVFWSGCSIRVDILMSDPVKSSAVLSFFNIPPGLAPCLEGRVRSSSARGIDREDGLGCRG